MKIRLVHFYYVKTNLKSEILNYDRAFKQFSYSMFEGEIAFVVCYDDCGYVFYVSNGI